MACTCISSTTRRNTTIHNRVVCSIFYISHTLKSISIVKCHAKNNFWKTFVFRRAAFDQGVAQDLPAYRESESSGMPSSRVGTPVPHGGGGIYERHFSSAGCEVLWENDDGIRLSLSGSKTDPCQLPRLHHQWKSSNNVLA